jgi:hypothetical protein
MKILSPAYISSKDPNQDFYSAKKEEEEAIDSQNVIEENCLSLLKNEAILINALKNQDLSTINKILKLREKHLGILESQTANLASLANLTSQERSKEYRLLLESMKKSQALPPDGFKTLKKIAVEEGINLDQLGLNRTDQSKKRPLEIFSNYEAKIPKIQRIDLNPSMSIAAQIKIPSASESLESSGSIQKANSLGLKLDSKTGKFIGISTAEIEPERDWESKLIQLLSTLSKLNPEDLSHIASVFFSSIFLTGDEKKLAKISTLFTPVITKILPYMSSLTECDLEWDTERTSQTDFESLFQALSHCTNLNKLTLTEALYPEVDPWSFLNKLSNLKILSLAYLAEDQIESLKEFFSINSNPNLESISLQIDDTCEGSSLLDLFPAIFRNPLNTLAITSLFADDGIIFSDEIVDQLLFCIIESTHLQVLRLNRTFFRRDGIDTINEYCISKNINIIWD